MEGMVKGKVTWVDEMRFVAESGTGHGFVLDAAPESGGHNGGVRPMELLLLGVASCTAFDVVLILKRGREPIADCTVEIAGDRAETDPKVFTRMHLVYKVSGPGLSRAKVERAVALSKDKYCSASIMLQQVCEITHEIVFTETTAG
jgi:putative redox protein